MNYIKSLFATLFSPSEPDVSEYYKIENIPHHDAREHYLENKKNTHNWKSL